VSTPAQRWAELRRRVETEAGVHPTWSSNRLGKALLAVVDAHHPAADGLAWAEPGWCIECADFQAARPWPCATVRQIAEALGVEL
jgi:hypothetical protein